MVKEVDGHKNVISFRLSGKVRYQYRKDRRQLQLTLGYPLKSVLIHPSWRVVIEYLSRGDYLSLEKIFTLLKDKDKKGIESFLNNLTQKGFLERWGASPLSEYPFVSVIVPVRNRPDEIETCLNSLLEIVYPPEKLK